MTTILRPEQIRTASLYPLATLPERAPGTRILITRYWPRGFRKDNLTIWQRDLAPSTALLNAYKHGDVTWEQFADAYRGEIEPRIWHWRNWMRERLRLTSAVTLLCHEHDAPEDEVRCHRRLLREMLLGQDGDA